MLPAVARAGLAPCLPPDVALGGGPGYLARSCLQLPKNLQLPFSLCKKEGESGATTACSLLAPQHSPSTSCPAMMLLSLAGAAGGQQLPP